METKIWSPENKNLWKNMIYYPSNSVDLYIFRADLLGISKIGTYAGLYHTGIAFKSGDKTWVLDLSALTTLEEAVIPKIVNGSADVDGRVLIEYYSSETKSKWDSYWVSNYRSDKLCTITSEQYSKLIKYIFGDFVNSIKTYSMFTLQSPSISMQDNRVVTSTSTVYTQDLTCDTFPLKCFTFIQNSLGVKVEPLPMLRVIVTCTTPPKKVLNLKDPELLDFITTIDLYASKIEQILSDQRLKALMSDDTLRFYVGKLFSDISKGNNNLINSDVQSLIKRVEEDLNTKTPFHIDQNLSRTAIIKKHMAKRQDMLLGAHMVAHSFSDPEKYIFFYSLDEDGNPFFYKIKSGDASYSTVDSLYKIKDSKRCKALLTIFLILAILALLIVSYKIFFRKR
jgi:hypothetical protein